MLERERFARPKGGAKVVVSFRLGENEYNDLRKCAITSNLTMTDWLRSQIYSYKKQAIAAGNWSESSNR